MQSLELILAKSASHHKHLCPRQVLGARMSLLAGETLGLDLPRCDKRLLVIIETEYGGWHHRRDGLSCGQTHASYPGFGEGRGHIRGYLHWDGVAPRACHVFADPGSGLCPCGPQQMGRHGTGLSKHTSWRAVQNPVRTTEDSADRNYQSGRQKGPLRHLWRRDPQWPGNSA